MGPFIWTNLNPPSLKDTLCKVWLKFCSVEKDENVKSLRQRQRQQRQRTNFESGELKKNLEVQMGVPFEILKWRIKRKYGIHSLTYLKTKS